MVMEHIEHNFLYLAMSQVLIYVRHQENTVFGGWQKLSAAYANSAGSVAYSNLTGAPDFATNTNLNNLY